MKTALLKTPDRTAPVRQLQQTRFTRRSSEDLPCTIRELLQPLFHPASKSPYFLADSLEMQSAGDERFWIPRLIFQRTQEKKQRIKVAISAGIHGDEPAAVLGLIDLMHELAQRPEIGREYQLFFYPLCNPSGFVDGTRHSRSGKDLNREFWRGSHEPEVQLLEAEIRREKFDGIISLHTDDTSDGVYGFARGRTITEHLLEPALEAAQHVLPRCEANIIDGFDAAHGIIRSGYGGILSAPPEQHPKPFEIILETPQHASIRLQRQAFVLATATILAHYRRFISYAQDI